MLCNSETFMTELDSIAARCNYAGYSEKFVTFPPRGLLPLPGRSTEADAGCDVWDLIFDEALVVNPAFNIYRIFDTVTISLLTRCRQSLMTESYPVANLVGRSRVSVCHVALLLDGTSKHIAPVGPSTKSSWHLSTSIVTT